MIQDGRALTQKDLEAIQRDFFNGVPSDKDLARVFETVHVQRRVLREFFKLFKGEINIRESTADPIRNSTLAHFKELVSMEDDR